MALVYSFFKAEQLERRRRQEHEGGSRGPAVKGRGRGEDGARVEIWIRPSGQAATPSSQRGGSESSRDSEQDGELSSLSASDVRSVSPPPPLSHTHRFSYVICIHSESLVCVFHAHNSFKHRIIQTCRKYLVLFPFCLS